MHTVGPNWQEGKDNENAYISMRVHFRGSHDVCFLKSVTSTQAKNKKNMVIAIDLSSTDEEAHLGPLEFSSLVAQPQEKFFCSLPHPSLQRQAPQTGPHTPQFQSNRKRAGGPNNSLL